MRPVFAVLISPFMLLAGGVTPVCGQTLSPEEETASTLRVSSSMLDCSQLAHANFRSLHAAERRSVVSKPPAEENAALLPARKKLLPVLPVEYAVFALVAETREVTGIRRDSRVRGAATNLQAKNGSSAIVRGKIAVAPRRKASPLAPVATRAGALKAKDDVTRQARLAEDAPVQKEAVRIDTKSDEAQLVAAQSGAVLPARAVSKPEPDIPAHLSPPDFDGKVIAKVIIEADGSHTPRIITGTGSPEMDAAILIYLRGWRWEPATRDGKPVRSENKVTLKLTNE